MMSLAIFFLFFTPLVFFHELGHFLVARLFGVKVEKFSIGIGPKLWGFTKGETEYIFALFPIGGYIKMFGEDLLKRDEVPELERKKAYNHQSPWARFWIVLAGPLANFILAFFLFLFLVFKGQNLPESRFVAWKEPLILQEWNLKLGDKLLQVNNKEVRAFEQLLLVQEPIEKIIVERDGKEKIIYFNNKPVEEFSKALKENLEVGIKPFVVNSLGDKILLHEKDSQQILLANFKEEIILQNKKIFCKDSFWLCLRQQGYYPQELKIKNILIGEAADELGLKVGDILLRVQNKNIFSLEELKEAIKDQKELDLLLLREGKELTLKGSFQGTRLGIETELEYSEEPQILLRAKSLPEGFLWAFKYTYKMTLAILEALRDLIFKKFDLAQLGGPIAIGKMANKTFEMGANLFLKFMAIFSVNLAVMNLLPIPVLDGGHIVILTIESIIRRPLPEKVIRFIFSLGFILIFYLMLQGLFNDLKKSFFK